MASGPAERARLLGLTRDHILTHGVVGHSLSGLARAIGSNNRMVLYHFGSLDALLDAAVAEVLDRGVLVARLAELMAAEPTAEKALTAAWSHLSDPARLPHLRIFFARFGVACEHPDRDRPFLDRTGREWTETVGEALSARAVVDAEVVAATVVGLWRGLQVSLLSGQPRTVVDATHAAAVAALLQPARPSTLTRGASS